MAIFEAPIAHVATQHGNPYSSLEFEEEWEVHPGSHYTNTEFEEEWEVHPGSHYTNTEFEEEWEVHPGSHYTNTEFEEESEFLGNILRGIGGLFGGGGEEGEMEFEDESDPFFGKIRGLIGRIK